MKLTMEKGLRAAAWLGVWLAWMGMSGGAGAQGFTTTTVEGTVYQANGQPGSGTLQLSWPAFTTANNQAVAAGRTNVPIGADGYVSVILAPNQGSTPAGLYYTAVYHLNDGTTSTEYWTVPAAAQASLSQVRAQVMPAAQAVQAVSKGYVDQSIAELTQSLLTSSGGSLTGPLFLNGDPTQPTQAATKHYVDNEFSGAVPLTGGVMSGPLTSVQLGAAYQVDQFPGADFGSRLQACLNRLDAVYGGTCDARNFTGAQAINSTVVIATANATVQLPCATIATANQIQITAGTRNVTLRGCALRGASKASGTQGGTVFLYSGNEPMIAVGDRTYATDTPGFHLDNVVINTTASTNAGAQGLAAYRTQELDLESLYFLGNSNQTGMTLDGTGNYTGGTFQDLEFGGFGIAVNAIGHQVSNVATTDWLNASTFVRLHIDCPMNGGSPVTGTYGINLLQGDGNTFTGGDVEGCATALHLGPNAQNNTIIGLRNENSISQVIADAGSAYNNWITGGTMFTGRLTDNGTRNSFLDTFHRSFNSLNGDWYGSQQDATVTNHFRIGTGTGNERGLLNRFQTDYGYRWTTGLSDATAGEQFYQILDELNSVYRVSIGQYNQGQSSTNNQTVINAAGTGAIVLNGSANAGTGGVIFGAGGSTGAAVATINSAGNAQFVGSLQVGGPSTFISTTTVKNQADAEIDSVLWAGTTGSQKESFVYKDYTGASQWYMVKDANNNWALNSAIGGLDSFKAYQSNNSGDTYINASNGTGHIRLNYETGSGNETDIYSGSSSGLVAAFLGSTAIKFPGLAASSGHNCLQIDNSGYLSNTGGACGTGSGMNGTVNTGNTGQVAYYAGNGTVIAGMNSVAIASGGTGATSAAQALQNLGAQPVLAGVASDGASGLTIGGNVAAASSVSAVSPMVNVMAPVYGTKGDGVTDDTAAIQSAIEVAFQSGNSTPVLIPAGRYLVTGTITLHYGTKIQGANLDYGGVAGATSYPNRLSDSKGTVIIFAPTTQKSLFVAGGPLGGSSVYSAIGISGLNIWGNSSMDTYHCTLLSTACGVTTSLYAIDFQNVQFSTVDHVAINGFYAGVRGGNGSQENTFDHVNIERSPISVIYTSTTNDVEPTSDSWHDCVLRTSQIAVYGQDTGAAGYSGDSLHIRFDHCYFEDVSDYLAVIPRGAQDWEFSHNYGESIGVDTSVSDRSVFYVGHTDPMVGGSTLSPGYMLNALVVDGGQYAGAVGAGGGTFLNVDYLQGEISLEATDAKRFAVGVAATSNTRQHSIFLSNPVFNTVGTLFSGITSITYGHYRVSDMTAGNDVIQLQAPYIESDTQMQIVAPTLVLGSSTTMTSVFPGNATMTFGTSAKPWSMLFGLGITSQSGDTVEPLPITATDIYPSNATYTLGKTTPWADVRTKDINGGAVPTSVAYAGWNSSGQPVAAAAAAPATITSAPLWLQYLANGVDGANTNASGNLSGEHYYTNFTVPFGNTVSVNSAVGLQIHATGSCTIAGTIDARGQDTSATFGFGGGSGGGSGGGAAAGTFGANSSLSNVVMGTISAGGGVNGGSSGGNGGNGSAPSAFVQRVVLNSGGGVDGNAMSGAQGKAGGSSGGAPGNGGASVILICASITGTDGSHTGIIDASGQPGAPPTGNSTGAGSGGGGGVVLLSSQTAITTPPIINVAPGAGGIVTVPMASAVSGTCTTMPKVTLGLTGGAFSSCAVAAAGAGCGTGANVSWKFQGGGGTQTTAAINPTWSGGALASCTVTAGDSAGYTVSTYTTAGTGGDGGAGITATFTGW